ncbi:putative phage DNA primase [Klebsiella michiganensis]|nr:putative phage DNA primase [Klebsiella michiganensis]
MNTKQAAIGRWAEIFKHYGLPGITGKNHLKGNALCVAVPENSAATIKTAPAHTSACVDLVMAGPC